MPSVLFSNLAYCVIKYTTCRVFGVFGCTHLAGCPNITCLHCCRHSPENPQRSVWVWSSVFLWMFRGDLMWKCGASSYWWGSVVWTGSGFPRNLSIRDRNTENCWPLLVSSCVYFCQQSSSHHHYHHDHHQAGESQSIQIHPIHVQCFNLLHRMNTSGWILYNSVYLYNSDCCRAELSSERWL